DRRSRRRRARTVPGSPRTRRHNRRVPPATRPPDSGGSRAGPPGTSTPPPARPASRSSSSRSASRLEARAPHAARRRCRILGSARHSAPRRGAPPPASPPPPEPPPPPRPPARARRPQPWVRREGPVGAHPRTTLPRPPMAEPMYCYRHPDRETMVSCSECGRPICPDCMVFAPVGIRCPEHAGQAQGAARVTQSVRRAGYEGPGAIVTKILVAMNVGIYLLELAAGGDINGTGNRIFTEGALYGPAVAAGDWWRLFTAPFLHYGPIHLAFNMLALWGFGSGGGRGGGGGGA